MEHMQVSFWISGKASDLTHLQLPDRPVFDYHQFATEQSFVVLLAVPVAQHILVFLGKYLPPVVGEIFVCRFVAGARINRAKMLQLLLQRQTNPPNVNLIILRARFL